MIKLEPSTTVFRIQPPQIRDTRERLMEQHSPRYSLTFDVKMQIKIKTLTGKVTDFNVEPEESVRDLKQALEQKEGIAVDQIKLIFK